MPACPREAAVKKRTADRPSAGQLWTLLDVDSLVRACPAGLDRDEFHDRKMAAPEEFVAAFGGWHCAQPSVAERLQIFSRVCDSLSAFAAACSFGVGPAAGHFVLDLSG